jgi:hypothetical protein
MYVRDRHEIEWHHLCAARRGTSLKLAERVFHVLAYSLALQGETVQNERFRGPQLPARSAGP